MVHVLLDLEFVAFVNMKSKNSNPLSINQLSVVKKNLIVVLVSCGSTINDNCSYAIQTSFSSGVPNPCTYTVCPVGNNICRIRYDFTVWMI